MTERFQLEARTIARLTSPNTVRLYDFGTNETGGFYFVMELLTGMDVATIVERFGPLPPERVVAVLRQVCRSLGEAHAEGVLHRDIKPQNLFLCRLGLEVDVVKVLDFGLVKTLDDSAGQITAAGSLTGTPSYMPPERVLGGAADERSDLYSLGCVAYWMLTGRQVFSGEPMAVMIHHARTAPVPPSKVAGHAFPAGLEEIVLACLDKDPAKRPESAVELWRRLGDVALTTQWSSDQAELWWREHLPQSAGPVRADSSGDIKRPPAQ
jgi:serine/threonine-protein kinase